MIHMSWLNKDSSRMFLNEVTGRTSAFSQDKSCNWERTESAELELTDFIEN